MSSGLLFPGNASYPSASASPMMGWNTTHFTGSSAPMARWPATYIWRCMPRPNTDFWSGLFHANYETTFSQGDGFYGCHPYPHLGVDTGTPFWEVSANGSDLEATTAVVFAKWFTQVVRVDAGGVLTYYWDWSNLATAKLSVTIGTATAQSDRAIIIGDAPWDRGFEVYSGVIRGLQFYDAILSEAQTQSEIDNIDSVRLPWYLNLNPTPSDISDKSGNGNNPAWFDATRPGLWSDDWSPILATRRAPGQRGPFDRHGFLLKRKFDYTPTSGVVAQFQNEPAGVIVLVGQAPVLTPGGATITGVASSVRLIAQAPTFTPGGVQLQPDTGVVRFLGQAPSLAAGTIAAPAATIRFVGQAPTLLAGARNVAMPAGAVRLLGQAPTLTPGVGRLAMPAALVRFAGAAPTMTGGIPVVTTVVDDRRRRWTGGVLRGR